MAIYSFPLSMTNRQLILIIFHILQRLQPFIFRPSGQKILVWSIRSLVKVFSLKRYFHTSGFFFGWLVESGGKITIPHKMGKQNIIDKCFPWTHNHFDSRTLNQNIKTKVQQKTLS